MALVITDTGKNLSLSYLTGKVSSTEEMYLKLYTNDVDPTSSTTVNDLTYLADGNGYTAVNLVGTSWSVTDAVASYPTQTWNFTGAVGNVYGYGIVTETSNVLIFAERFLDGPYNVLSNGDIINVAVSISLS